MGNQIKSSDLRHMIARRLRAARMAFSDEAKAVADATGISKQTLYKYKKGETYPDELFLVRFCQLTGCPTDFLFLGKITSEMEPALAARIAVTDPELIDRMPPMRKRVATVPEPPSVPAKPSGPTRT